MMTKIYLFWADRVDFRKTKLVMEVFAKDWPDLSSLARHFEGIALTRRNECPDGWGPMVRYGE